MAAGLERWFEAYANGLKNHNLKQQIAPFILFQLQLTVAHAFFPWREWAIERIMAGKPPFSHVVEILRGLTVRRQLRIWSLKVRSKRAIALGVMKLPYGQLLRAAIDMWGVYLANCEAMEADRVKRELVLGTAIEHHTANALGKSLQWWLRCVRRPSAQCGTPRLDVW